MAVVGWKTSYTAQSITTAFVRNRLVKMEREVDKMRAKVIVLAVTVIGSGVSSLVLAITGVVQVAIMHAGEDIRNWERWNDNDDRRSLRR